MKDRATQICEECAALSELLIAKNKDYGDSAFHAPALNPGLDPKAAILVRIGDKIERLQRLATARRAEVASESFNDTIRDLAGYCILYLVATQGDNETTN